MAGNSWKSSRDVLSAPFCPSGDLSCLVWLFIISVVFRIIGLREFIKQTSTATACNGYSYCVRVPYNSLSIYLTFYAKE